MKVCPKCGRKWPDHAKFCPVDGTLLEPEEEKSQGTEKEKSTASGDSGKKRFSETKWFMIGDHIKEEEVTPEDILPEDLDEVYKKTGELPPEIRKKYSLEYSENNDKKD